MKLNFNDSRKSFSCLFIELHEEWNVAKYILACLWWKFWFRSKEWIFFWGFFINVWLYPWYYSSPTSMKPRLPDHKTFEINSFKIHYFFSIYFRYQIEAKELNQTLSYFLPFWTWMYTQPLTWSRKGPIFPYGPTLAILGYSLNQLRFWS